LDDKGSLFGTDMTVVIVVGQPVVAAAVASPGVAVRHLRRPGGDFGQL